METDPDLDDPTGGISLTPDFSVRHKENMARFAARSLPSDLSFLLVWAYFAITCNNEQKYDSLTATVEADFATISEMKGWFDQKLRELRISENDLNEHIGPSVNYILNSSLDLTYRQALRQYLDQAKFGHLDLTTDAELKASDAAMRSRIYSWLRKRQIPFTAKSPIVLPATTARGILDKFKTLPDLFVVPDIPAHKLSNAMESIQLPDLDSPLGLVDCTIWGSAKDCVVIGSRGIYFTNLDRDGFLPYSDFPDRTFYPAGEN